MKLDVYSPCPGGLDKKIKFCCGDMLSHLELIQGQLDGEQFQSALQSLDQQLAKTPDRACLLALKYEAQRAAGNREGASDTLQRMRERFPDNPIVAAHLAVERSLETLELRSEDDDQEASEAIVRQRIQDEICRGRESIALMQDALAASRDTMHYQVYEAIRTLGPSLLVLRRNAAAREFIFLAARLAGDTDQEVATAVSAFLAEPSISLLQRVEWLMPDAPPGVPWQAEYNAAARLGRRAQWRSALDQLETLASQHGEHPLLLRGIAFLAEVLGETEKAAATLRSLARLLDPMAACECEALAIELDLLDGRATQTMASFEIEFADASTALEQLQSSTRLAMFNPPPQFFQSRNQPPPRAIFHLLDRERRTEAPATDGSDLPRILTAILFYGKETDRPARLRWQTSDDLTMEQSRSAMQSVLGDLWQEPRRTTIGFRLGSLHPVGRNVPYFPQVPVSVWRQAEAATPLHAFLELWPDCPQPLFGGRTPRQAAADRSLHGTLQAAICLLESYGSKGLGPADAESLRSALGLESWPLDLPCPEDVYETPPVRLARINFQSASDENLAAYYLLAARLRARFALERIASEILKRPPSDVLPTADATYATLGMITPDAEEAISYLEKAQQATTKLGASPAEYLLRELRVRLQTRPEDAEPLQRIISTLTTRYASEPGVREGLVAILVEAGIIQPDGRPRRTMGGTEGAATPSELPVGATSNIVVGNPPAAEPAKEPAASKLWLPGQD